MKKMKLFFAATVILASLMIQSCQKEKTDESPNTSVEALSVEPSTAQKTEVDAILKKLSDSVQIGGLEFLPKAEYSAIQKADEKSIVALNPDLLQERGTVVRLATPPVLNQGNEGSCTAFSIGYVGVSYLMYAINRLPYTTTGAMRSPEFLFNTTKISNNCSGAYMRVVLNSLINTGVCSWSEMPYTSYSCSTMPNSYQRQRALQGRISTYYTVATNQLRTYLANGYPVMMGFTIDDQFMIQTTRSTFTYRSRGGRQKGGHAVAIVGFNDNTRTYTVQNSWGTGMHDRGFFYVSYDLLPYIASEMYVMMPRR
jgi:C1A family cysteine protease